MAVSRTSIFPLFLFSLSVIAIGMSWSSSGVEARYLPTRDGGGDRLDKLRELLRDMFESELERAEFQQEMRYPGANRREQQILDWENVAAAAKTNPRYRRDIERLHHLA